MSQAEPNQLQSQDQAVSIRKSPSKLDLNKLSDALIDDRYKLESEIGRGGMGAVYKAKHLLLGRTVAIKFLSAEVEKLQKVSEKFAQMK